MPKPAHDVFMAMALREARRAEGLTRPNPAVGAVLVKSGRVLARGFHHRAGLPHAEIEALRVAGSKARGATLYVTLEPCSTWGRTPPCTEAILASGVKHVVVGCRDPNPKHAGRGLKILRAKGLRVEEGILGSECEQLIAPFASVMTRGVPFVTLKLAMSADGRIADKTGASKWITGPEARKRVQALRRRCDAVMVGVETALADDPSLLPRPANGRIPFRVIVDSRGRLPLRAKCLTDGAAAQTIVATTERCPTKRRDSFAKAGATVLVFRSANGRVPLRLLLRKLAAMGVMHLLCEGGAELADSLIRAKRVDRLVLVVAPRLLGGASKPVIGGAGWPLLTNPTLRFGRVDRVGDDLWLEGRMN